MGPLPITVSPVPLLQRGALPDLEVERRHFLLVTLGSADFEMMGGHQRAWQYGNDDSHISF